MALNKTRAGLQPHALHLGRVKRRVKLKHNLGQSTMTFEPIVTLFDTEDALATN